MSHSSPARSPSSRHASRSGCAPWSRQCSLRMLLVGMHLCLATGHQGAHLTAVHAALCGLDRCDQERLGVVVAWRAGPHLLTYRQITYTTERLCAVLQKDRPNGAPSDLLQRLCDALIEGSVPARYKNASSSYAIDWTDVSSFSCPPSDKDGPCADPEAAWGHRRGDSPGQKDELLFGYHASAMTMVRDEDGTAVPELIRKVQVISWRHDPVPCPSSSSRTAPRVASSSTTCSRSRAMRIANRSTSPCRCGRSARSSSSTCTRTTGGRRAPFPAPSATTATCTAPPRRRRCSAFRRLPGARARRRWPPPTSKAPSSRATSSAGSPQTTTAITAWAARRCSASAAARCGRPRWPARSTCRRSSSRHSSRRSAPRSRASPSPPAVNAKTA